MSLQSLIEYESLSDDDVPSSNIQSTGTTQDVASLKLSLQRVRDNLREAFRHRASQTGHHRLPDMLFLKGIDYEMVRS